MHTIKYASWRTSPFSNSIRDTPVFVYAHEIRLRFKRICIVTCIDRHVATVAPSPFIRQYPPPPPFLYPFRLIEFRGKFCIYLLGFVIKFMYVIVMKTRSWMKELFETRDTWSCVSIIHTRQGEYRRHS